MVTIGGKTVVQKVLITGATGFLGRALVEKFLENGSIVTVLVRNPRKIENKKIAVYKFNLENLVEMNKIIVRNKLIDSNTIVIHCAAILGAAHATKKNYNKINGDASFTLFKISNQLKANKFVFISSIAASGPIGSLDEPITEDMLCKPRTYYGRSKLQAEQSMINYTERNIPLIIIRPPLIFGPGMIPGSGAALLFDGCKRRIFGIVGNGKNYINLIYIDNLVNGIITCAMNVNNGYEIFFLADNGSHRVLKVMDEIKLGFKSKTIILKFPYLLILPFAWLTEIFGKLIRKDTGLNVEFIKGMATHVFLFSIDKAKNAGFKPTITLKEGINRTIKYLSMPS